MEEILKAHLCSLADAFSAATGATRSAIGSRALSHSRFFERITQPDISLTLKSYDRLVAWFAGNWPEQAVWPTDIPRPSVQDEPFSTPDIDVAVAVPPEGVDLLPKEHPDRILPADGVRAGDTASAAPACEPTDSN